MANENKKKYASLETLKTFLDNAKSLFATQTYADELASAISTHNHNNIYYSKTEIDNMEFITVDDIDSICGTVIQIVNANDSEVTF